MTKEAWQSPVYRKNLTPVAEEDGFAFREGAAEPPLPMPSLELDFLDLDDHYEVISEKWSDTLDMLEAREPSFAAVEEEEFLAPGNNEGKGMVMEREGLNSSEEPDISCISETSQETEGLEEAERLAPSPVRPEPERSEVGAIKYSSSLTTMEPLLSEPFKLRYYRVQWGEDLSAIAERLSASIAKIKEINTIEEEDIKVGTVLRIP